MINKIQCISFEINAFEQYSDWAIFHRDTFKKISRLIYKITEDEKLIIYSCKGHYDND